MKFDGISMIQVLFKMQESMKDAANCDTLLRLKSRLIRPLKISFCDKGIVKCAKIYFK